MELTLEYARVFDYIIKELKKLKYANIKDVRVYKVDISYFVVLNSRFIKIHKQDIGKLFIDTFKKFKHTSAIFTFVSKEKIKDRYIEVTDKLFSKTNNQNDKNLIADLNIYIEKSSYKKIQKIQDKDLYYITNNACNKSYMTHCDIFVKEKNYARQ